VEEMQAKEYPFLYSDVFAMFDELMAYKAIELPDIKRLHEVGREDDPNYSKYHRLIGHPIEKCFVFKGNAVSSISVLLEEEKATANQTIVTFGPVDGVISKEPISKCSLESWSLSRLELMGVFSL